MQAEGLKPLGADLQKSVGSYLEHPLWKPAVLLLSAVPWAIFFMSFYLEVEGGPQVFTDCNNIL